MKDAVDVETLPEAYQTPTKITTLSQICPPGDTTCLLTSPVQLKVVMYVMYKLNPNGIRQEIWEFGGVSSAVQDTNSAQCRK